MRVTTCLFWYAEDLAELWSQVTALEGFADRLVAVNGRWDDGEGHAFPEPERDTTREEVACVVEAAETAGIDVTVHRPSGTWPGEVAQRNYTLKLALVDADWIFLMDADERVVHHSGVRDQLEQQEELVGTVDFHTLEGPEAPLTQWEKPGETCEQRRFFRANPGLRFHTHHWWLVDDKWAYWGHQVPGLPAAKARKLDVRVEHRTCLREPERWQTKREFAEVRDLADEARGFEW